MFFFPNGRMAMIELAFGMPCKIHLGPLTIRPLSNC